MIDIFVCSRVDPDHYVRPFEQSAQQLKPPIALFDADKRCAIKRRVAFGHQGAQPHVNREDLTQLDQLMRQVFKVLIVFGRQAEDHIDLHLHKPDRLSLARHALDVLVFCFSAHDPAQAR